MINLHLEFSWLTQSDCNPSLTLIFCLRRISNYYLNVNPIQNHFSNYDYFEFHQMEVETTSVPKKRQSEQQLNIYLENSSKLISKKNLYKTTPDIKGRQISTPKNQTVYEDEQIPKNLIKDREFRVINQTVIEYEDKLAFVLSQITPNSHVNGTKVLKQFNKWNGNIRNSLLELFDSFQLMGLDNINFTVTQLLSKFQKVQANVLNKTIMLLNHIQSQYIKEASPLSGNNIKSVTCQQCGRIVEKVHLQNLRNYLTKVNQTTNLAYSVNKWRKQIQILQNEKQFSTKQSSDFIALINNTINNKNNFIKQKSGETYDYLVDYLTNLQQDYLQASADCSASIHDHMSNNKLTMKNQKNRLSADLQKISVSNIEAVPEIFGQLDNKIFQGFDEQITERFQKIIRRICQLVQYKYKSMCKQKTDNSCQTSLIKPSELTKILQKQKQGLQRQLQLIKKTKRQLQIQTIKYINCLQANEARISQLLLANKSFQYQKNKAQQQLKIAEQILRQIRKSHQQQLQSFISKFVEQKQGLNWKIKQLEKSASKLNRDRSDASCFKHKEVQTQQQAMKKDIKIQNVKHANLQTSLLQPATSYGDQSKSQKFIGNLQFLQSQHKLKQHHHRRISNFNVPNISNKKGILENSVTKKSIMLQQRLSQKSMNQKANIQQSYGPNELSETPKVRIIHLPCKKVSFRKPSKKQEAISKPINTSSANSIGDYIDSDEENQYMATNMKKKNSNITQIQGQDNQSQKQNVVNPIRQMKNAQSKKYNFVPIGSSQTSNQGFYGHQSDRQLFGQTYPVQGSLGIKKIRKSRMQKVFESLQDKTIYQQYDYSLSKQKKHQIMQIIENNYDKLMKMGVIQFLEQFYKNQACQKTTAVNTGTSTPNNSYRLKNGRPLKVSFNQKQKDATIGTNSMIGGFFKQSNGLFSLKMMSKKMFANTTQRHFDSPSGLSSRSNFILLTHDLLIQKIRMFPELCEKRYPSEIDLMIFGGRKEALKFQRKQGFWEDHQFLAVDNYYMKDAKQIVTFFMFLKNLNSQCYNEYYRFIQSPITYLRKKQNQEQGIDNQSETSSVSNMKHENSFLLKTFKTVIRVQKYNYKNCKHIEQFLNRIPCYPKYCQFSGS